MTCLRYLAGFLPAVYIAEETGADLLSVTSAMATMRLRLRTAQVMENLSDFTSHDKWDRMAIANLQSAFLRQTVNLTRVVIAAKVDAQTFLAAKRQRVNYYLDLLESLRSAPPTTTSPYMVLLKALESLED